MLKFYPYKYYYSLFDKLKVPYRFILLLNNGLMKMVYYKNMTIKENKYKWDKFNHIFNLYKLKFYYTPITYYSKNMHIYNCNLDYDRKLFDRINNIYRDDYTPGTVYEYANKLINRKFRPLWTNEHLNFRDDTKLYEPKLKHEKENYKLWVLDFDTNYKINHFFNNYFTYKEGSPLIKLIYSFLGDPASILKMLIIRTMMFDAIKRVNSAFLKAVKAETIIPNWLEIPESKYKLKFQTALTNKYNMINSEFIEFSDDE